MPSKRKYWYKKKTIKWPPKREDENINIDELKQDTNVTELGLSTVVIASNIPKADEGGTWEFPSPQRFYNAMKKKGWDPNAQDIPIIVSIHNTINEQVWSKILDYEFLHFKECAAPKLKKFHRVFGKPSDMSPKAKILSFLGYTGLFDRHDWYVDRCGTQVRYIIDFYNGKSTDPNIPSVYLDVRPALDSINSTYDRVRVAFMQLFK